MDKFPPIPEPGAVTDRFCVCVGPPQNTFLREQRAESYSYPHSK